MTLQAKRVGLLPPVAVQGRNLHASLRVEKSACGFGFQDELSPMGFSFFISQLSPRSLSPSDLNNELSPRNELLLGFWEIRKSHTARGANYIPPPEK